MGNNNGIILVGAGLFGAEALNFFGFRNVYCFADNHKAGLLHYGKFIISIDELKKIHKDYTVILSISPKDESLGKQLDDLQIPHTHYYEHHAEYEKSTLGNPRILTWKDAFKGQKCFLIGNGPSLLVSDLDKIKKSGIKSMACNFINKIFDKTDWRPELYCCEEASAILLNKEFILNYPLTAKFIKILPKQEQREIFNECREDIYLFWGGGAIGKLSEEPSKIIYDGHTVMFPMLTIAMYMGFSEIYLLGVDNSQPPGVHTSDFLNLKNHFYDEDTDELNERRKIMRPYGYDDNWSKYFDGVNRHYQVARDYAEAHGIKIYNATRGGQLDVFERIDVDKVLGD